MRFIAPSPESVCPSVFSRPPLGDWDAEFPALLARPQWPAIIELDRARRAADARDRIVRPAFVEQDAALLADGLHYEQRVAAGVLATRRDNWHDLLNALVWLRYPRIKHALNARQFAEIGEIGTTQRTRAQCAMTHFDEAGAIVLCSDPDLIARWDAHDWHALFCSRAASWGRQIAALVFGHALLEHALLPGQLLVGKALVLRVDQATVVAASGQDVREHVDKRIAALIAADAVLGDPQELRPLPLSGIPGWHADAATASFVRDAPCFRPLRPGRRYPAPQSL